MKTQMGLMAVGLAALLAAFFRSILRARLSAASRASTPPDLHHRGVDALAVVRPCDNMDYRFALPRAGCPLHASSRLRQCHRSPGLSIRGSGARAQRRVVVTNNL